MNKYLLLRDNKQTGPHSYEEMLQLGFRKYDLVWVEGKSAAWRYPGEVSEFASFAPLVEEQPYDRFFKKPVSTEQEAVSRNEARIEKLQDTVSGNEAGIEKLQKPVSADQEVVMGKKAGITSSESSEGVMHEEIEKRRVALADSKSKQDDSRYLPKEKNEPVVEAPAVRNAEQSTHTVEHMAKTVERHRKVAITLPATRRNNSTVTLQPQKKESEPRFVPVPSAVQPAEVKTEIDPPVFNTEIRSVSNSRDYTQYLQYAGVAAALISLLVVGILIGMGISTDTPAPVPVISEQPTRINELKEKLSITAAEPEVKASAYEPGGEQPVNTGRINKPVKKDQALVKEAVPVTASYQTSDAPGPATYEAGREAVKRERTPPSNISENIVLSLNDYKVNMFGGIDGIEVSVTNGADVPVEEVVVELRYILSNRNKKYLTETVSFRDLKPGETKTLPGPKSNRGIKLESYIVSAK